MCIVDNTNQELMNTLFFFSIDTLKTDYTMNTQSFVYFRIFLILLFSTPELLIV
jgi:hypothetical protein